MRLDLINMISTLNEHGINDYDYTKGIFSKQFKLSSEVFRQKKNSLLKSSLWLISAIPPMKSRYVFNIGLKVFK